MAYYNANEVIRLTRKAMGLTQEQLCEGICEIVTLSRIENGHTSVKRSTYKKLMEKMGRIPETRYAICVSKDGVLSEDRLELERAIKRYDFEVAEHFLQQLKENADDNIVTKQYIIRMDALINYRLGRIETGEFAKRLEVAMGQTVPLYEKYLENKSIFPFSMSELMILTNLAVAYRRIDKIQECIQLYEMILRCLEVEYLGEPDNSKMQVTIRYNLAMVYEGQNMYRQALEEIEQCLELAVRYDYGYCMAPLISAKVFNIIKLVKNDELGEEKIFEAKKLSQQAYYIAVARGDEKVKLSISEFNKRYV